MCVRVCVHVCECVRESDRVRNIESVNIICESGSVRKTSDNVKVNVSVCQCVC